jgi:uncharacterized membrane protein
MSTTAARRGYLDWVRGLAVLIMIEAHLLDSWTRFPDRQTEAFAYAIILGGFGAPLFLLLAGIAVPLSAGSKFRRSGDATRASRAVVRRGLEIFGLAFLFRAQSWILSWAPARTLLRVDILNIMGPSIAAAAAIWGAARTERGRFLTLVAVTLATALLAPVVRSPYVLTALPDSIEAYFRPVAGLSNFVFLPWAGFVFAGAAIGVVLDAARTPERERRANLGLAAFGFALAVGAYAASFAPSLYSQSHFWTTSPAFFFLRLGILAATVPLAYLWESRPGGRAKWSPLRQLGRTSLFVYWIHVEVLYGLMSLSLHKSLSWTHAWLALACFTLLMLGFSIVKDQIEGWWQTASPPPSRAESGARFGAASP